MSIKYFCDCCKKEITVIKSRVVVQVMSMMDEKKTTHHLCQNCWSKDIEKVLTGAVIEKPLAKEPQIDSITASVIAALAEESTVVVETGVKDDKKESPENGLQSWEVSQSKGSSKYFTDEICPKIHRFILLGSKPYPISRVIGIPYQSLNIYFKSFNKDVLNDYTPKTDVSKLKNYAITYNRIIPKIKALLATGTWSFTSIASECNVPEKLVQIIWDELPWFMDCNADTDTDDSDTE